MNWGDWDMISKTSFFNKGIYKSTVKRYAWGSVLYFIVLFIVNILNMILSSDRYLDQLKSPYAESFAERPLILRGDFLGLSMFFSIIVPTVAVLLVFRFLHSKKASVFTHSIPVKRSANYVSSLLASFTLMSAPVIVTGIILMLMSFSFYGQFYTAANCLVWVGILLFALFILTACSVFSAVITGNSFAVFVLNVLVHCVVLIVTAGLINFADVFLLGFDNGNPIFEKLAENNFVVASFSLANSPNFREDFTVLRGWLYVAIAVVFYLLSLFLYKKRNLENAEDVAGFKCLEYIFRYGITFVATISAFAIFSYYIDENPIVFTLILLMVSAVSYFATQMVLKKSLKIFAKSYKGYIAFALSFLLCVGLFAFTSFFGFETRIPDINDVQSVSIYNHYYSRKVPVSQEHRLKEFAIKTHEKFVSDNISSVLPDESDKNTYIYLKYDLSFGRELSRQYMVTTEERDEIMTFLYKDIDYKKQCEPAFKDCGDIQHISIYPNYISKAVEEPENSGEAQTDTAYATKEEAVAAVRLYSDRISPHLGRELLEIIRSDVEKLDYMQLRGHNDNHLLSIGIEFSYENDDTEPQVQYNDPKRDYINLQITADYTKTLKWLKDKGIILE